MSVPEPERHKGRLEVHVKAQALAAYTALILKNPKVFDPEIDSELINRIRGCAYDIYVKSWSANRIRAETNATNRRMRYDLWESDRNAQNHQADGASGNGRRTEPNKVRTGIGTQQYGSAV